MAKIKVTITVLYPNPMIQPIPWLLPYPGSNYRFTVKPPEPLSRILWDDNLFPMNPYGILEAAHIISEHLR